MTLAEALEHAAALWRGALQGQGHDTGCPQASLKMTGRPLPLQDHGALCRTALVLMDPDDGVHHTGELAAATCSHQVNSIMPPELLLHINEHLHRHWSSTLRAPPMRRDSVGRASFVEAVATRQQHGTVRIELGRTCATLAATGALGTHALNQSLKETEPTLGCVLLGHGA
eukprot:CAMPEP_0180795232 /NCGR_PEP_ID=MMETSP1038_2-20121128/56087_1 /TAXON_ID=632150 /ORGANISM="Azadinium spinosum, Strain 3D9" /LENGTH=170 /DNA_ID=CAMNT_0022834133 /DNA_START=172 /DNA_END=680 /DNA_ORIENTATION=+